MSKKFSIAVSGRNLIAGMLIIALTSAMGAAAGVYLTGTPTAKFDLETLKLHASGAAGGEQISLATGLIDGDVEGVYVLDHLTGNLQCWVISPRTVGVAAIFSTNVSKALELDRAGEKDFVMTTGQYRYTGGNSGQQVPASSIVYVGDGNSGNVAAFGLQYNKTAMQKGDLQEGTLQFLGKGPARLGTPRRDQ